MRKILVVEDDQSVLRLLKYTLEQAGYQVLTVANGFDALRKAHEEKPDLILLDIMLPGLDGFEVCYRLRAMPQTAEIPILILSAKGRDSDRDAGLKLGADEYLVKPAEPAEVVASIERLLAQKSKPAKATGRVIAFIGAKGGVGTSTAAVNIAIAIAQRESSVILVDLCSYFGAIPLLLSLQIEHNVADLFQDPARSFSHDDLQAALTKHPTGISVLSSGQSLDGYREIAPSDVEALLDELRTMADYILIDMSLYLSNVNRAALGKCDFVILVTGSGPDALTRIKSATTLLSRIGVEPERLRLLVIDRGGPPAKGGAFISDSITEVPLLGIIPYDNKACIEAEALGIPAIVTAPSGSLALALKESADRLISQDVLASGRKIAN